MDSNCRIKIPINSASSCLFKSIGQLCTSLYESYVISCITHQLPVLTSLLLEIVQLVRKLRSGLTVNLPHPILQAMTRFHTKM